MEDITSLPEIPNYIDLKEAARRLKVSESTVYRYVQAGHLPGFRAGHNTIMIEENALEQFKPRYAGRPRKNKVIWRVPTIENALFITTVQAEIYHKLLDQLQKTLEDIVLTGDLIFPGTIARYITQSETQPHLIKIELVWREVIAPDEETRQQQLEEFKTALADVLDWSTAQYEESRVLLHT